MTRRHDRRAAAQQSAQLAARSRTQTGWPHALYLKRVNVTPVTLVFASNIVFWLSRSGTEASASRDGSRIRRPLRCRATSHGAAGLVRSPGTSRRHGTIDLSPCPASREQACRHRQRCVRQHQRHAKQQRRPSRHCQGAHALPAAAAARRVNAEGRDRPRGTDRRLGPAPVGPPCALHRPGSCAASP